MARVPHKMATYQDVVGKMEPAPRQPAAAYSGMLRKMTGRLKQLQDEVAAESATNIEFEEASRRSFEFLAGQIKALKGAFNTLTDTFLEELEQLSASIRTDIIRLGERQGGLENSMCEETRRQGDLESSIREEMRKSQRLENRIDQIVQDMDVVLGAVPKIEDDLVRMSDVVTVEKGKVPAAIEGLEVKIRSLENHLREELEQRHLKLQKSVTRQLESLSKVLIQETSAPAFPSGTAIASPLPTSGAPQEPTWPAVSPLSPGWPGAGALPWPGDVHGVRPLAPVGPSQPGHIKADLDVTGSPARARFS